MKKKKKTHMIRGEKINFSHLEEVFGQLRTSEQSIRNKTVHTTHRLHFYRYVYGMGNSFKIIIKLLMH